ncbi:MAG: A/G-specific adenine glycosylase [Fimbriiglobus sp.]
MTVDSLPELRQALLAWFAEHRRDLPWRTTRDPYRIWVSEVMLQQTTVAAVVPYFHKFLARFPTLRSLAEADEQTVLAHWQGLGYYRRARHLHAAAQQLVSQYGDDIPSDPAVWAELPGVGRYILGAVMSQAFEAQFPIVEANSLRVLARWYAYPHDPRTGPGHKWVWSAAEAVLPESQTGDFNQALMELGSLVCTPKAPKCDECPVAKWCQAKQRGLQASIPPPPAAKTITEVTEVGVLLFVGEGVLLFRRPDDATRGAGLWEFPHADLLPDETESQALKRLVATLTGLKVKPTQTTTTTQYSVTRFRYSLTTHFATAQGTYRGQAYADSAIIPWDKLPDYAISSPQRAVLKTAQKSWPR